MTDEQINAWAYQTGLPRYTDDLRAFAHLAYEHGRKDENEACAKVAMPFKGGMSCAPPSPNTRSKSMTIFDQIKAKQAELTALIATLEKPEDVQPTYFEHMGTRYQLDRGETYVCTLAHPDLAPTHTILLPFDRDDATWDEQMAWAKGEGFELPNRLELLMMWLTMRERFQKAAYWSNEPHHEDGTYAWFQYFGYGGQLTHHKSAAFRAVAVRRITI